MFKMSSEIDVSDFIDKMLAKYDEEIKTEKRLVNEVHYPISRSYSISTGLSPARGFIPAVNITHKRNCISFISVDWEEFLKFSERITEHTMTRCGSVEEFNTDVAKLKLCYLGRIPALQIDCRDTLTLKKRDIIMLLRVAPLISQRLRRLEVLDFRFYYNYFLHLHVENKEKITADYAINLLSQDQCNWNSEYVDSMLEILLYYFEHFKHDLTCL